MEGDEKPDGLDKFSEEVDNFTLTPYGGPTDTPRYAGPDNSMQSLLSDGFRVLSSVTFDASGEIINESGMRNNSGHFEWNPISTSRNNTRTKRPPSGRVKTRSRAQSLQIEPSPMATGLKLSNSQPHLDFLSSSSNQRIMEETHTFELNHSFFQKQSEDPESSEESKLRRCSTAPASFHETWPDQYTGKRSRASSGISDDAYTFAGISIDTSPDHSSSSGPRSLSSPVPFTSRPKINLRVAASSSSKDRPKPHPPHPMLCPNSLPINKRPAISLRVRGSASRITGPDRANPSSEVRRGTSINVLSNNSLLMQIVSYQDGVPYRAYTNGTAAILSGHISLIREKRRRNEVLILGPGALPLAALIGHGAAMLDAVHSPEETPVVPAVVLQAAVARGDVSAARWALERGDPGLMASIGNSCLIAAANRGDLPMIQWLVSSGLSVAVSPRALQEASRGGYISVVFWLLTQGCLADAASVSAAAVGGHTPVVHRLLLAAGPNAALALGTAALTSAAGTGKLDLVRWLWGVGGGALDPTEALEGALGKGHWEVASFLLSHLGDLGRGQL